MKLDLKALIDKLLEGEEPFSLTVNVSATNESEHCFYNNHTKTVRITASIYSASSYWGQTQAFWTIPEKYRPKTALTAPAVIMSNSMVTSPYFVNIGTDGTVKQSFSSACRCIYFSAEYTI